MFDVVGAGLGSDRIRTKPARSRWRNQPLSGNPRHGVISMMDATSAVIAQRVGEGVGNLGRIGGAERRIGGHASSLPNAVRTDQELAIVVVMRNRDIRQMTKIDRTRQATEQPIMDTALPDRPKFARE